MSFWTNIRVILQVHTYVDMNYNKFKGQIEEAIRQAPNITGSEGNTSINTLNFIEGASSFKDGKTIYYTDRCHIVIIGNLRDRFIEDTRKELKAFVKHLRKYRDGMFYVDYDVNIIRGYSKKKLEDENRDKV